MNKAWEKLKKNWEENPAQMIALAGFAALAVAKLLDASTRARNSRTYSREIDRRIMKQF